jgi:hypothetical protein
MGDGMMTMIETEQEAREYVAAAMETDMGRELLSAAGYQPDAIETENTGKHMLHVANLVHWTICVMSAEAKGFKVD